MLGKARIDACPECAGLWLTPAALRWLLESAESNPWLDGLCAPGREENETVRYLRCPCCHTLMNRSLWAKRSGVVVDACRLHGLWLDRGELQALRLLVLETAHQADVNAGQPETLPPPRRPPPVPTVDSTLTPAPTKRGRWPRRSAKDRKLAGVCGGLAEFLGWDSGLVRTLTILAFILTAVGPVLAAYLFLWILMQSGPDQPIEHDDGSLIGDIVDALLGVD